MFQVQKIKFRVRFSGIVTFHFPLNFDWVGVFLVRKGQWVSQSWDLYWLNEGGAMIRLSHSKGQWFLCVVNSKCLFFLIIPEIVLNTLLHAFPYGKQIVFHSLRLESFILLNIQHIFFSMSKNWTVRNGKIRSLAPRNLNLQIISDFG